MTPFRSLALPTTSNFMLQSARVPRCLLPDAVLQDCAIDAEESALVDVAVGDARITNIVAAGRSASFQPSLDLGGRQVWPTFIDVHTHLDKGHILDRATNRDGTFTSAREATAADRALNWSYEDLSRRMTFGLRCAEAHGVSAIRTHLDSYEGQAETTWAAFRDLREDWKSRVALQGVALVALDVYRGAFGEHLADIVAAAGGILGGATRATAADHEQVLADLDPLLDRLFSLAGARDLDVDLHVDECGDVDAMTLHRVARAALRHGYAGRVTCGHCCCLALQDEARTREVVDLLLEAKISIVSLPPVNMYLQDRAAERTPRWRGVAPVKELRAAGVRVAVAGDNCRDPFHAYGDHDMLDTLRQAARILHLDHPFGDMATLATRTPAAMMGLSGRGVLQPGEPADLILFNARSLNELMCRPQHDRIVVRNGRALAREVPDYAELEVG
jgi:cytosine deaminase